MEHLSELYVVLTSLVTIASVICNYTSTPKDDAIVAKAYKILEKFAFLGGKAKQQGHVVIGHSTNYRELVAYFYRLHNAGNGVS